MALVSDSLVMRSSPGRSRVDPLLLSAWEACRAWPMFVVPCVRAASRGLEWPGGVCASGPLTTVAGSSGCLSGVRIRSPDGHESRRAERLGVGVGRRAITPRPVVGGGVQISRQMTCSSPRASFAEAMIFSGRSSAVALSRVS